MAPKLDRRTLLKSSAAATGSLALSSFAHGHGSEKVRIGLIGCGGRGTGAAEDCIEADPAVELVAMGDLFADRIESSKRSLAGRLENMGRGEAQKTTDETTFAGWDAYQKVIDSDVDIIVTATPPAFRPMVFEAAIAAGKHVFMEKPVAVDPPGVRRVIAAARKAKEQNLSVVAGTQRRHQKSYLETMQRIHEGAIGEVVAAQCWWNQGGLWVKKQEPNWSDMEWQVRNWLYFTWASGDHIVEQHIHNLDVVNWAMGGAPVKARGMGGRQSRTQSEYGNIFDHFAIEYEYASGAIAHSYCRQINGCANRVAERLVGTKGTSNPNGSISGENEWKFGGGGKNPYVQEHIDLIASIRNGDGLNEGERVAHSTLTAIMGRMSAYTGRELTWDEALNSEFDLTPPAYAFGDLQVNPVAIPGEPQVIWGEPV